MERILRELIQLEKKRNSLLTDINENLKIIASKENLSSDTFREMKDNAKQYQKDVGKSAFTI